MTPTLRKLNLGCGRKKLPGHLNVDRVVEVQPDLVHDLNVIPLPLPGGAFDEICAYDVVEHLDDLVAFMREVWRLAAPDARVLITTPHFSCANAFMDPTHQRQLSCFSFDYFTTGHPWNFYGSEGFALMQRQLIFTPTWTNKLVSRLANRFPRGYEQRWAWIFPAWFIYFELAVVKTSP